MCQADKSFVWMGEMANTVTAKQLSSPAFILIPQLAGLWGFFSLPEADSCHRTVRRQVGKLSHCCLARKDQFPSTAAAGRSTLARKAVLAEKENLHAVVLAPEIRGLPIR